MINQIIVNELPHIKSDIQFINEVEISDLQSQIDSIIIPDYEEDFEELQSQIDSIPDYSSQITNINNNINNITNDINNISASDINFDNNNETYKLGELSGITNISLGNNGMTMYWQVLFSFIIEDLNVSTMSGYITSITFSLSGETNQCSDFNGTLIISTGSIY
jgi:hypothetical protein